MYLTSFVHRQDLFEIAERWFCGRPRRTDALRLTQILICDGFIVGVTLESIARSFLPIVYERTFYEKRIRTKGELRDAICLCTSDVTPRVLELCRRYQETPDFYYREAPINGVMCVDEHDQLLGLYRIKRPKRIAEKANRHFAAWLFKAVQNKARRMAEDRAQEWGIPIEYLVTPEKEMEKEFVEAERSIARSFLDGRIEFDRAPLTINDVGGIKVLGEPEKVARLESFLESHPNIRIVEREELRGHYQATNLILDVEWDPELVCRRYRDSRSWENYLNRGIPEDTLKEGLEPLIENAAPTICIELILSTFPDMVESELGNSIHEERIIPQRDNREYKGCLPMNVEFLLEYLFSVGFSPEVDIEPPTIKLWGRYLPDTLVSQIRRLYRLPEYDFFY